MSPVVTPKPRPATARLLFVGIGPDEHLSLQRLLENWKIQSARSCAHAVAALDSERPAVVVCEEELQDGSWRSVVSAAQALSCPPPVIVVSYRPDERLWAEVLRKGGFDLLGCPLDPSRVSLAIDHAVERAPAKSSLHSLMRMAAQGY